MARMALFGAQFKSHWTRRCLCMTIVTEKLFLIYTHYPIKAVNVLAD